jgi:hypothetical protein
VDRPDGRRTSRPVRRSTRLQSAAYELILEDEQAAQHLGGVPSLCPSGENDFFDLLAHVLEPQPPAQRHHLLDRLHLIGGTLSTTRKNGVSAIDALTRLFEGNSLDAASADVNTCHL